MELNQFIQIGLPVSLALIMLSLGLTIRWSDFTRQLSQPRSTLVGLFAQLLLVPVLALGIISIFQLPPGLAAGLMILSFCPGGVTSNWFSHMAKANVPLSISLTVIASLITPFTIPALSELALQGIMGDSREVHIPLSLTMMRLFIISVLPVAIGMLVRARYIRFSQRWQPLIYRVATSLFLCVIAAIIFQQWVHLPGFLAHSGIASLSMILAGMALGLFIARISRLNGKDTRAITIEVGMQNGGMALVVTQNVLHSAELSIVPVIYGLIMLVPIFLYSRYARTQSV
jgi:BASS family bile acid:Na+ symporter